MYWLEKYYNLIRNVFPDKFFGMANIDDFAHRLATYWMAKSDKDGDISIYPYEANSDAPIGSKAYCEDCYEQGYAAIINDGKLIGFRKEKPSDAVTPEGKS